MNTTDGAITRAVTPATLAGKVWDRHVVERGDADLLYVDMHLLHELTSPQAFEGLRLAGRAVRRPDLAVATADHNVPPPPRGCPCWTA